MPGASPTSGSTPIATLFDAVEQKTGTLDKCYRTDNAIVELLGSNVESGTFPYTFRKSMRRPHNVGYRALGDATLPRDTRTVGASTSKRVDIDPQTFTVVESILYGGIDLDGVTIDQARLNPGPVKDIIQLRMLETVETMKHYENLALTAKKQGLAEVLSVSGATVTFKKPDGATAAYFDKFGSFRLEVGGFYNFISPADTVRGTIGHLCTGVNLANATATFSPNPDASVVIGDMVCEGDTNGNSWNKAPDTFYDGAGNAALKNIYLGVNRTTYPEAEGTISNGGGTIREFSIPILIRHILLQQQKLGFNSGYNDLELLMRPEVWAEPLYGARLGTGPGAATRSQTGLVEDINFTPTYVPAGVGRFTFSLPSCPTLAVNYQTYATPGTVLCLSKKTWHLRRSEGIRPIPGFWANMVRAPGSDQWNMMLRAREALYCDKSAANGWIDELLQHADF